MYRLTYYAGNIEPNGSMKNIQRVKIINCRWFGLRKLQQFVLDAQFSILKMQEWFEHGKYITTILKYEISPFVYTGYL